MDLEDGDYEDYEAMMEAAMRVAAMRETEAAAMGRAAGHAAEGSGAACGGGGGVTAGRMLQGERRTDERRPEAGQLALDRAWTVAQWVAGLPSAAPGGGGPLAATVVWLKCRGNRADCRQEAARRGTSGQGRQLLSDVDAGPSTVKDWQPGRLDCGRIPRGSMVTLLGDPLGA
eukprot:351121-Chlamydomonas_euryale.AAC.8